MVEARAKVWAYMGTIGDPERKNPGRRTGQKVTSSEDGCLRVKELAARWHVHPDTIRKKYRHDSRVMRFPGKRVILLFPFSFIEEEERKMKDENK